MTSDQVPPSMAQRQAGLHEKPKQEPVVPSSPPPESDESEEETDPNSQDEQPPMLWHASREGISEALRDASNEFRECYVAWRRLQPELSGRISISFEITRDPSNPEVGRVTSVQLGDSELQHPFLEGCILGRFYDFQFEGMTEDKIVTRIPMMFKRMNEEGRE